MSYPKDEHGEDRDTFGRPAPQPERGGESAEGQRETSARAATPWASVPVTRNAAYPPPLPDVQGVSDDSDSIRRAIHFEPRLWAAYNIGREVERSSHTPDAGRETLREAIAHLRTCIGLADNEIAHGDYSGEAARDIRRARDFLATARAYADERLTTAAPTEEA